MTEHVKVYGVKPRIQYTADGSLTTYEFPFAIFSASDLDVYFGENLQDTAIYTVAGVGDSDGGSITFASAPAADTIITIVRNLSIERTSDFQEGATLRAKVLNDELDYQVACQQQIADNLNRSMVLPPYAADNDLDLTLPLPSAGKAIVWNAAGTNLENSSVSINALESTLNGYKTAAETAADTAMNKASAATEQAQTATTQAGIATTKAGEAAFAVNRLNGISTNGLTGVSQDINIEFSSYTVTLKAGSKLYVPAGFEEDGTTPKFDIITIENDVSISAAAADTNTRLIYYDVTTDTLATAAYHQSGTAGYSGSGNCGYYFTDTNILRRYLAGVLQDNIISFPIAQVTGDGSHMCGTLDKVFNGLGYIGKTIFALPGLKGLIPNGRNADGTLNNTEFSVSSVLTRTSSSSNVNSNIALQGSDLQIAALVYDERRNVNVQAGSDSAYAIIGAIVVSSDVTTSLTVKTAFHAVDWNDKRVVVGWGAPKWSSIISVTSGYTAPQDGYFQWNVNITQNRTYSCCVNSYVVAGGDADYGNTAADTGCLVRCSAGDVLTFTGGTGRFMLAKGV